MHIPLTLFTVLILMYVYLWNRYTFWKRRNVPFCKPKFIVGNFGELLTLSTSLSTILKNLHSAFKEYRYVGLFNMWTPAVLIRDPELVKDVLVKDFQSYRNWFVVEDNVDPVMCLNPFVLYGSKWKEVRNALTPQFTLSKIKGMMRNFQTINEKMIRHIKNRTKLSQYIEIRDLATRYTGDTVMLNAFSLDGRSFQDEYPDSFKIAKQFSSKSRLVQLKQTASMFTPYFRQIFKITFLGDAVPQMFNDIIMDCITYRNKNNIAHKDYIHYLNELKEKSLQYFSSNNDIAAHDFTFFLDGFETSASTFSYALIELSQNEQVQIKARDEINTILQKYNGEICYEALQDMKYIERIVFETLRKHPVIKFLGRVCIDDIVLPSPHYNDDSREIAIKKGTAVFISCEAIHNDDKYYPNPNEFDPDRFLEENKNARPKYSFLGFGDGLKSCLGKNFALAQIKLGLFSILSAFKLEMRENTKLPLEQENIHLFMSPKSEVWLNFIPRNIE